MSENAEHADKNVEIWKVSELHSGHTKIPNLYVRVLTFSSSQVKKLIKSLEAARGNGTSMISLIIPPGDQACVSIFSTFEKRN